VLKIKDLKFRWPSSSQDTLSISSLEIQKGERVFLKGPSGSGKSTLLNLVGGVLTPNSGEILFDGENLFAKGASQRDQIRGDHMGFIFQMFNLLPYLSAEENVILPCNFSDHKRKKISDKGLDLESEARRLLSELGLSEKTYQGKSVSELSVGQQQRVATARALMGSPELIVADEPTSALDSDSRDNFIKLLFKECDLYNSTLIFVSHDAALGKHFDKVISLEEINNSAQKLMGDQV
jgi:putative ABC transport system ATP-binding protein